MLIKMPSQRSFGSEGKPMQLSLSFFDDTDQGRKLSFLPKYSCTEPPLS
jgi:hypothetical protein